MMINSGADWFDGPCDCFNHIPICKCRAILALRFLMAVFMRMCCVWFLGLTAAFCTPYRFALTMKRAGVRPFLVFFVLLQLLRLFFSLFIVDVVHELCNGPIWLRH